ALFGPRQPEDRRERFRPAVARLRVTEREVMDGQPLRVARIRADRFTGGVVDGGLFDEEPHYGGGVTLTLEVRCPRPGVWGLVRLALKALLTGGLPLGGGSAVGRGVVRGRAEVRLPDRAGSLVIDPQGKTDPETARVLNGYVEEFHSAAERS